MLGDTLRRRAGARRSEPRP